MSADAWVPLAGLTLAVVGGILGWFVPTLIARIPEPEPEPIAPVDEVGAAREGSADRRHEAHDEAGGPDVPEGGRADVETSMEPSAEEEPKERYDAIADLPGLAWKSAVASAVTAGLVGAKVGWDPILLAVAYLVPVGVALAVVDWRTRLLPTKVIAPSYAVVAGLTVVAGVVSGDWDSLLRAVLGWLVAGGTFFVLWFVYPRGLGYGDVRLSGLLGIVLGYLGWGELLTGVYAGFLLGGVGGLLLSVLRIVDRKAYPFGPFMLVGAVVGVLLGPGVAAWYA
jgi:leader peptidase (prepilin peptidase)/N-methyltransferase